MCTTEIGNPKSEFLNPNFLRLLSGGNKWPVASLNRVPLLRWIVRPRSRKSWSVWTVWTHLFHAGRGAGAFTAATSNKQQATSKTIRPPCFHGSSVSPQSGRKDGSPRREPGERMSREIRSPRRGRKNLGQREPVRVEYPWFFACAPRWRGK